MSILSGLFVYLAVTKMSKDEKEIKSVKKESKKEKKERKLEKKSKKRSREVADKETVEQDEGEDGASEEDQKSASSKATDDKFEEIEIDLNAGVPLSKKQQRLLKKGKLDVEKLAKKHPAPKPELTEEEKLKEEEEKKSKKSDFGVWIGNLSFDTTKEDLTRFIIGKTAHFKDQEDTEFVTVENIDITRVNLPKKDNKIKGFAYVDLPSMKHVNTVISLSEEQLNGRKLLIKNANSFEGRPSQEAVALSKNPPSRILFVGNLSFDTTQDLLEEHFRHCGDIVRIRMATFEDTGKCKGFAFIDFKDETGPTTALKSKLAKKFINRPLRLEYGEDRSKRNPNQARRENVEEGEVKENRAFGSERPSRDAQYDREKPAFDRPARSETNESPHFDKPKSAPKKRTFRDDNKSAPKRRLTSSVALATAQRASAAIVPSSGKKITFD
ncbi:uncharacterized protein RJT20DRAFT_125101 [Scheffersomyces xylosifermentans]|uniref:uncharacterized protein n=1 Tax=Scheffersomyces xylosifermentans TaxID=1304137 RepID=UPI00315DF5E4